MWRHCLNSCSDPVFKITRVSKLATCPGQTNTVLVKLTDHKQLRVIKSGGVEEKVTGLHFPNESKPVTE
jgi:hypothetical protein